MPVFAPQIRFACTNITGYNDHKLLAKSEEVNYLMAVKICHKFTRWVEAISHQ